LDNVLKNPQGQPRQIPLYPQDRQALIAFFHTLTDTALANDVRYSNPFRENIPQYNLSPYTFFDFTLSPNPLPYNGQLKAQFVNQNNESVLVNVVTVTGIVVHNGTYTVFNNVIMLPPNAIASGTYVVHIRKLGTNESAQKMLVVN
jgi:hypothetical protein